MSLSRTSALLFAVAALFAAACGGDDGDLASSDGASETSSDTGTATEDTQGATQSADEASPSDDEAASTAPATSSTTTIDEPDELALLGAGPYTVGVTTIEVIDAERERPLTVDVWFPLAAGSTGEAHQYTLIPGTYYESPAAVTAEPDAISADGPFPLVLYSHGSGGLRYIHSSYTEAIASHGYVVMAPDHTGNTAVERLADTSDDPAVIAINRPLDISTVIDAALDPAHPTAGPFATSVDGERIAVTGHSFGGYTAYAMASGVELADTVIAPDDRVDLIIPLAPATRGERLSDERLAAVDVPTMIIVGTDDVTTPVADNVERPWTLSPASPHHRVELVAGEHQTFTDLCEYQDFIPSLDNVLPAVVETIDVMAEEGCSPGDMDSARAADLTNTFAIGFLDAILKDGTLLEPDTVTVPDDVLFAAK